MLADIGHRFDEMREKLFVNSIKLGTPPSRFERKVKGCREREKLLLGYVSSPDRDDGDRSADHARAASRRILSMYRRRPIDVAMSTAKMTAKTFTNSKGDGFVGITAPR